MQKIVLENDKVFGLYVRNKASRLIPGKKADLDLFGYHPDRFFFGRRRRLYAAALSKTTCGEQKNRGGE